MQPTGKLIIIGGAVDKGSFSEQNLNQPNTINFFEEGILHRILEESAPKNPRIEVLTTASLIPKEVGREYIKAFNLLGSNNVGVMNIESREMANSKEICDRLTDADVLVMTGGDQLRLTSILGGTNFHEILIDKYQNTPFLLAGTSAGAAACSNNMIYEGSSKEALLKGEVKITGGLGLINDVIIDTHFVQRGRIGRLLYAAASNPRILGIGLGEDTGLLIKDGHFMEAIGSGLVILVDGRNIRDTNITDVEMGLPVSIDNLTVHVMAYRDTYDLHNRKLIIRKPIPLERE